MNNNKITRIAAILITAATIGSPARAALLAPTPYASFADSPFHGGGFAYFHLENFEGGTLSTPGVSAWGGSVLGPSPLTDSVDADDDAIDGYGTSGHSWYAGCNHTVTFSFDGGALGGLPTHAGIVWTDVGYTDSGVYGPAPVLFEAFDGSGASLGLGGPFFLGDGSGAGQAAEDRFFGVVNPSGISRLSITMPTSGDWELDHLQYGRSAIPEPGTAALLALGMFVLLTPRRVA